MGSVDSVRASFTSDGICSYFRIPARRDFDGCAVCGHEDCAVSKGED